MTAAVADSLSPALKTPATGSEIPPSPVDDLQAGEPVSFTIPTSGEAFGADGLLTADEWETLPVKVRLHPLLERDAWLALRDSGRVPLDCSPMRTTQRSRAEFLVGAWLIDKIVPPGLGGSLLGNLQPQMLRVADILAASRFRNAILEPRRSAKTTALWCVLLGRCWVRPVYMAGYTMLTTAKKAAERYRLDVRNPITRQWRDAKTRPVALISSNGAERVEFENGSVLAILSPNGDDVRSGAYDLLVLDEAGEAEPDLWGDIIAAVVPSFDTRGDDAQLVLAGTGGKYRDGSYFWTLLHADDAGRLRYGVPDDYPAAQLEAWEAGIGEYMERMHPGLDGLTTLAKIRANFPDLGADRFSREYAGYFNNATGRDTLLNVEQWAAGREASEAPEGTTPEALAFAVHPGGLYVSIAVAWNLPDAPGDLAQAAWALDDADAEGAADRPLPVAFKLVHHQEGNAGVAAELWKLYKQLRLPIVHDDSAQENEIMLELQRRARRRVPARKVRFSEKAVAATKLVNGIKHGNATHWPQLPLDKAAGKAVARPVGKARLVGAPDDDTDVSPLEAAALALLALPARKADAPPPDESVPLVYG